MKILTLIMLSTIFACSRGTRITNSIPMTKLEPRILALGDSYTFGEGVIPNDRWPNQLSIRIRQAGLPINEPVIIARTGWTTNELAEGILTTNPQGIYALVTLQIGVNNQYRGWSLDNYRGEFRNLLNQAIEYAGGDPNHVLVLSIPDWGVTPFARAGEKLNISRQIDDFNRVITQETQTSGAHYIDITPISRRAASDSSLLAPDGLHPSQKMYQEWVALIFPIALSILQ